MQKTLTETIVYRSLADLRVSSNNYRHGDVGAIVTSILTFGFNATLRVWRDGVVKAGNHSLLALQSIKASGLPLPRGIREENGAWLVPCFDISHLSQIQADAFMIADNRLTALGSDDDQRLAELLTEIASEDAKLLAATGYDGDDLDLILSQLANDALSGMEAPDAQIDKADELREKWQTERGQLWAIGKHMLLCGDSTNTDDVARVMGGEKAALLASDPPYNVDIEYGDEVDDSKSKEEYERFSRQWFAVWSDVTTHQIVTPGCNNLASWLRWFDPYHVAPWTKTNAMTNGKVSRWWCWEPVLFFGEKWGRSRSNDIFDFPIGQQKGVANHPCPKPLAMWVDVIANYTERGAIVCDAFMGSGTTLVACEQTGRMGRGIEIDPRYVAVTLQRLADMGLTPQLLTD